MHSPEDVSPPTKAPDMKPLGLEEYLSSRGLLYRLESWVGRGNAVRWYVKYFGRYFRIGAGYKAEHPASATGFDTARDAEGAARTFEDSLALLRAAREVSAERQAPSAEPEPDPSTPGGLRFDLAFAGPEVHPFDEIEWTARDAEIRDGKGNVIWHQEGVEAPAAWSDQAVKVTASKYFHGDASRGSDPRQGGRESSVRQLMERVCGTIARWGQEDGYFASGDDAGRFFLDLIWLCTNQHGAFNSPVWFNVGHHEYYDIEGPANNWRWDEGRGEAVPCEDAYKYPQGSACFIQSVSDDMAGIMALATSEAMLFKFGSGTGTDLSPLRSSKEKLQGGGRPSGPVSFLRIYDSIAAEIKSGGKCLAYDQPVFTAGGIRTAEQLATSGERFIVLSFSKRLGRVAAKEASAWFSGTKAGVEVVTDKGVFRVSADHPFMLRTGEAARADSLRPGMSLMPITASPHKAGYVRIGLQDGKKGRSLLHQLVAKDVLGWDLRGKVVHHENEVKTDCVPSNLRLKTQAEHARDHGIDNGAFFSDGRPGESNGMHRNAGFWADAERADAYRAKQGATLRKSGRAAAMQSSAVRNKMLNVGYELINAGYDISTFHAYCDARYKHGRRVPDKAKQAAAFERNFGSYGDFLVSLSAGNHRVVEVRPIGEIGVVSVEVHDHEPDDKRPWSEHNYALAPIGSDSPFVNCVVSLNTRRAAKLNTLKVHHPDILEFIECKAKEDAKARALIAAGYSDGMTGDPDEAYSSVAFQNANISVRATDAFLKAVEDDDLWETTEVTTGRPSCTYAARFLMRRIAEGTWACGDPGMQYEDTIQRWHTCPNTAPINSANPCAEFNFIDDSACNLASLNLMKFRREDGSFDAGRFRAACRIFITAQEILVDRASYPTEKIAENSHKFRPLGLGYANLGALIMASGLPYDSDEGRSLAGAVTAIMHGQAYHTSSEIARDRGPFDGFEANRFPMMRVIGQHCQAAYDAWQREGLKVPAPLFSLWGEAFSVLTHAEAMGGVHGFRNSQVTCLAPTGTIAFQMDCDTTGVEPAIALVIYKQLAGGGVLKIINGTVRLGLEALGYDPGGIDDILAHIEKHDTIEGAGALDACDLPVFDCAFPPPQGGRSIDWRGHVKMMAAVQPFLSGAISKTCNVPAETTVEEIREMYLEGWRLGLKSLAIYRDGSKGAQPLSTKKDATSPAPAPPPDPVVFVTAWGDVPTGGFGEPTAAALDRLKGRAEAAREAAMPDAEDANDRAWRFIGYASDALGQPEGDRPYDRIVQPSGDVSGSFADLEARFDALLNLRTVGPDPAWKVGGFPVDRESVVRNEHGAAIGTVAELAALANAGAVAPPEPRRERLPATRHSLTHKFRIGEHEGYVNVGFYPDGRPGEVFLTMAKEGSTIGGLADAIATTISIGLQYGVPVEVFARKLAHARYEPHGLTGDPAIPLAKSITDYVGQWLGNRFVPGHAERDRPHVEATAPAPAPIPLADGILSATLDSIQEKTRGMTAELTGIARSLGIDLYGIETAPSDSHAPAAIERMVSGPDTLLIASDKPIPPPPSVQSDAPMCHECGSAMRRIGPCFQCSNCFATLGSCG